MNNPQAFPIPPARRSSEFETEYPSEGMSLRDYFAAKAMQGLLACVQIQYSVEKGWILKGPYDVIAPIELSTMSGKIANAMLTEREKETT